VLTIFGLCVLALIVTVAVAPLDLGGRHGPTQVATTPATGATRLEAGATVPPWWIGSRKQATAFWQRRFESSTAAVVTRQPNPEGCSCSLAGLAHAGDQSTFWTLTADFTPREIWKERSGDQACLEHPGTPPSTTPGASRACVVSPPQWFLDRKLATLDQLDSGR
jgi:hypothetical protein